MSTVGLFGRQFTEVGSNSSDFLIKTKGKVKIQWGNKFIDLIKDGKIAVEGFQFHTAKDKESITGEDGFYITNDGGIYIKFGNNEPINILGEGGSTYVSFIEEQEILPEQKYTAQKNIGLIFDTLAEAQAARLQNGIVFIADEGKIYIVHDGQFQELTFEFPNPYTQKFTIQIGQNDSCSLLIDGYYDNTKHCIVIGKENAGLYLYSTTSQGVIQSKVNQLILETGDGEQILIESNRVTIKPTLVCDSIQSTEATSQKGFRLYSNAKESTLEIDNLVLRKGVIPQSITHKDLLDKILDSELAINNYYIIEDFQNEWELTIPDETDKNVRPLLVHSISENQLSPKAVMLSNPNWEIWYDVYYNDTITTLQNEEIKAKGRITQLRDEFNNQCNYDFKHLQFKVNDTWVYTFGDNAHDNTIIVDNYEIQSDTILVRNGIKVSFQGKTYNNSIKSIYYDLITSEPFTNNIAESLIQCNIVGSLASTHFHGTFTKQTFSSVKNPELAKEDKFTDIYMNGTELRIICIPDLIIPGMIIMFNGGRDIPDGWAICDGTNGTPNLIGSFIKASTTAGQTGGNNEYMLSYTDIPQHNHNIITTPSVDTKKILVASKLEYGVYDAGGDKNYALYAGKDSPSENGYELIDNQNLANRLNMQITNGEYTQTPIKIEPKYYSLIFIMKL